MVLVRGHKDSASRAENKTKNPFFCFLSRGAAYLRRNQSSASRTQWQEKHDFFLPIVEAQPIFGAAKAVQAEHNEGVS